MEAVYPELLGCWRGALAGGATPVSVQMIVRDEQRCLARALRSLIDLRPREVVVGDTGSTDRTREIAEYFGCRVVDVPWTDHFAEARNRVLAECQGEWTLWLDADEELDPVASVLLAERIGGGMEEDFHALRFTEPPTSMFQCRLWRRSADAVWRGRVHEKVWMTGSWRKHPDIAIVQHPDDRRRDKQLRNIRLVEMELRDAPSNYDQHFHASVLYNQLGDYEHSKQHAYAYLAKSPPEDVRMRVYSQYLLAWTALFIDRQPQKCVELLLGAISASCCSAELWSLMADAYLHAKRPADAMVLYENAMHFGRHEHPDNILWLVDLDKYDAYPRAQLEALRAQGVQPSACVMHMGGPMGGV